jgi:glycosyltransferase involved in cell wall biosynthesis
VIKDIIKALDNEDKKHEIVVNYINREKYLPQYLPKRLINLFRIFYLRNISKDNYFDQFDIAITLQPDSHCIRHKNHIIYFQHHVKQDYDLFWHSFREKKNVRKKLIFVLLTAINRLADKIYLTSNLKNAKVIVNSITVGKRLKKYNHVSNFTIINPACNLFNDIMDMPSNITQKIVMDKLKRIDNQGSIILSFSRLNVQQKGIDIIIETAVLMPSVLFIIAGSYDPSLETINKQKLPENINLIVKDFSDEEKTTLFRRCGVFIAAYLEEDFGITPIEANAYGKPVVYCDDSGEMVHTQKHKTTGYMSSREPKDIAEGIEYCIKNKDRMKNDCINNASKYKGEKFAASLRKFLFQ